jgi:hypothetical protein
VYYSTAVVEYFAKVLYGDRAGVIDARARSEEPIPLLTDFSAVPRKANIMKDFVCQQ